ncbi:Toxin ParE3 [Aquisphaera giovannonii]|uniref:Toxin ParE3 n=1 Tax=Aquisphaera giovannonii TaxID=406548 RepID=A0A5B9VV75_9BACT|nr:type II toxin-antitoxin system RelE/ParE family toxin [Aquisphaera giovannonii]QEH32142.1 Toxin ParE3 [Aquisphaera giovannonii]
MRRVTRTRQAQQDLEGILDYLDGQGSEAADRFAARFDDACELYAAHPQMGTSAREYAPDLRHFAVMNYAVFYRPAPGGIEIIRILHGARDIPTLFES